MPGVGCQGGWRSFTIARKKIERYKYELDYRLINSEVNMRFCLIDEITELEPGRQINAVKSVSMAEEYLSDHFPGFPVLPGVFMLEAIVQTSAWLIRVTDDFAHSTVLLKESRSIKFPSFVEPGNQLMLSALIMDHGERETRLKVSGTVNGEKTLSGRLILERCNLRDTNPAMARADELQIQHARELLSLLWKEQVAEKR